MLLRVTVVHSPSSRVTSHKVSHVHAILQPMPEHTPTPTYLPKSAGEGRKKRMKETSGTRRNWMGEPPIRRKKHYACYPHARPSGKTNNAQPPPRAQHTTRRRLHIIPLFYPDEGEPINRQEPEPPKSFMSQHLPLLLLLISPLKTPTSAKYVGSYA